MDILYSFIFVKFYLLLVGHVLADYSFQTDFIARYKNWNNINHDVPWYHLMIAHCLVHSIFVTMITGSVILGLIECLLHFIIDVLKCAKKINIHVDQLLHVLCKIAWAIV